MRKIKKLNDTTVANGAGWRKPAQFKHSHSLTPRRVYDLLHDGKIKSAIVKARGNKRGMRLVSVKSVDEYLESIATTDFKPMALEHGPLTKPKKKRPATSASSTPKLTEVEA